MSREAIEEAIEVLEDASAEMLMETGDKNYYVEAIAVLRQALVDADDTRPQARSLTDELMDCVDRLGSEADTIDPRVWQHLLVYAPQKQEPVAWANSFDLQNFDMKVRTGPDLHHTVPLYTAPPKQWVGLTDEEVSYCRYAATFCDELDTAYMAELIEQALKEKNNG